MSPRIAKNNGAHTQTFIKFPNTKAVFPGKITEKTNATGIVKMIATQISGLPAKIGQSRPIINSRPGNLLFTHSLAASLIGVKAVINNCDTIGNNVNAVPACTPNNKAPLP